MGAHSEPASHAGPTSEVARRRGAAAEAGHTGDEAAARRLLTDDDPGVRAIALGAIARMGRATGLEVQAAVSDPSPLVRRRVAELAVSLGGPASAYRGLLSDPDPTVVEAACFAAGELSDTGAVDLLVTTAGSHADPLCRESAVAALGAIGDPAALPAILAALHDRPAVRRRAVIALAPFEGAEVAAALEAALKDRDWQVRQAAEDQLRPEG